MQVALSNAELDVQRLDAAPGPSLFDRLRNAVRGLSVALVPAEPAPEVLVGGPRSKLALTHSQIKDYILAAGRHPSKLHNKVGLALRAQVVHWGSTERPRQILELTDSAIRLYGGFTLQKRDNGTLQLTGPSYNPGRIELSDLFRVMVRRSSDSLANEYSERLLELMLPVLALAPEAEPGELKDCFEQYGRWVTEGGLLKSLWGKNDKPHIMARRLAKHAWSTGILNRQAYGLGMKIYGKHFSLEEYNQVVANLEAVAARNAETPNLLPLLQSMTHGGRNLEVHATVIAMRRDFLMSLGLTPAGWRWLSKQGVTWVRIIRTGLTDFSTAYSNALIRGLNALADQQVGKLPRGLCALGDFVPGSHDNADRAPLVRIAVETVRRRKARARDIRAQFDLVWDYVKAGHPVKKGATWASLMRRQHRWHIDQERQQALEERQYEPTYGWLPLVAEAELNGYRAVSLNDSAELLTEGLALRHCVAGYDTACHAGTSRIYTMLLPDGTKQATLEVAWNGKSWAWRQLRGYRNVPITDKSMITLSHQVVAACQAAYSRDPNLLTRGLWMKPAEKTYEWKTRVAEGEDIPF